MTLYPTQMERRFQVVMGAQSRRIKNLETRTAGIDSGIPLMTLPGEIDPAYTGTGLPKALVNGSATLTGPYDVLGSYWPVASDSVILVPLQGSYVIVGAIVPETEPWTAVSLPTGWGGFARVRKIAVPPNKVEFDMELTGSGSGTNLGALPAASWYPTAARHFPLAITGTNAGEPRIAIPTSGLLSIAGLPATIPANVGINVSWPLD